MLHQIFLSHQRRSMGKMVAGRVFCSIAGFMADEAGGLQEGLRRVYGNSVLEKLRMSEFLFLQRTNRQRARLHSEKSKEFFTRVTRAHFKRKPRILVIMLFKS